MGDAGRAMLRVAREVAAAGASVALDYFQRRGLHQWRKPDGARVTEADLAAEEAVLAALRRLVPGEAVLGEESGGHREPGNRWIVDPIDGTENFARGNPIWATLVAREVDGEIGVGAIAAPALRRCWWAVRGNGAFTDAGRRLRVSGHARREGATFCYGGLHECPTQLAMRRVIAVARQFRCAWGWGNFWGHVQVAEGVADAALSFGIEVWDAAAPALLVDEAGGTWSDVDGQRATTIQSLLTSNGRLHGALVHDLTRTALLTGAAREGHHYNDECNSDMCQ